MPGVESIYGFRGSGKSRLARVLCAKDARLLVCDTTAEYSRVLKWVPEVQPDVLRETVLSGQPFRAAFVPESLDEVQWLEMLAASQHNITLLIDEIDVWYERSNAALGEGLSWIVKCGRHYNQRLVTIARIASLMPVQIRAEGILWVFPIRHPGTRREIVNCTEMAFDPIELQVLEQQGDRVLRSQVARICGSRLQVLELDNRTGQLYTPRAVVATPEPAAAPEPGPESEAEPVTAEGEESPE